MIITKNSPFAAEEIDQLKEQFPNYIKTVIDIELRICSAGADRHVDSEQILLDQGSKQRNLWGGGIDCQTKEIDYNSFINIRPRDHNRSNQIEDPDLRRTFHTLMTFFFKTIL